jgi:hypothetical protein
MSIGFDPDTFVYLKDKLKNIDRKWAFLGGLVLLLILAALGGSAVLRPALVLYPDDTGISVKNIGGTDALIHKVDVFWYWAGQVAFIANMPEVHQTVKSEANPAKLNIPDIPVPEKRAVQREPFYMKLAVRYTIPHLPMFRYAESLFFEYDFQLNKWTATENIPLQYRSLGNLTVGDVKPIELSFH